MKHPNDKRACNRAIMKEEKFRRGHWTRNGLQLRDARGVPTIERARNIASTLGTFAAARYLWKRGWSVEAAAHILATPRRG